MPLPQNGILPEPHEHALFITLRRRIGQRVSDEQKQYLASIPKLVYAQEQKDPRSRFCAVLAFGSQIWDALWPQSCPCQLRLFPNIPNSAYPLPATEVDLFIHLRSERYDFLHEFAHELMRSLGSWMKVLESIHGFSFHGGRDLTGFVDGTGNEKGSKRAQVALVGNEDPIWAGGSYLHIQRYVHCLEKWHQLSTKQQETIIGRTKETDEEIPSENRASTAHLSRVEISNHGKELKILRHSMPYGIPGSEQGLYFCAYSKTPEHYEKMLTRMFSSSSDGKVDRLLDFTKAVTGAAFFAPSQERLKQLAKA